MQTEREVKSKRKVLVQKISGVTELVCEINWIQCKFSGILTRHSCHRNRRNTLSIDRT